MRQPVQWPMADADTLVSDTPDYVTCMLSASPGSPRKRVRAASSCLLGTHEQQLNGRQSSRDAPAYQCPPQSPATHSNWVRTSTPNKQACRMQGGAPEFHLPLLILGYTSCRGSTFTTVFRTVHMHEDAVTASTYVLCFWLVHSQRAKRTPATQTALLLAGANHSRARSELLPPHDHNRCAPCKPKCKRVEAVLPCVHGPQPLPASHRALSL